MVGSAPPDESDRMSTTPPAPETPQPPPPAEPPRRLLRSRADRMVAGVAGGLAAHLGVDPVIVRIALVALAVVGGAGVLIYLAAWLLVPEEAAPGSGVASSEPLARGRALTVIGVGVLLLVAWPIAIGVGGVLVPVAFLVLLGIGVAWLVTGKRPGREPAALARAALLGLGVIALCGVLALAAFWAAGIGGEAVVAGIVIAAGVAVLAGAFVRPVRWLTLPALAIALPAAFVSAAGIDLDGGYGEKTYRPGTAAAVAPKYELGAGRLVVDLRDAELPAGRHDVDIDLGMGEAVVIVPGDACVSTTADLGIGGVDVFDRDGGGIDVDFVDRPAPAAGATEVVVRADVGVGHLDVRSTDPDRDFRGFGPHRRFDRAAPGDRGRATGCA
jgi:phage shock protein PspC (stress-responsive transcriptional regulator)